jgi:hypothetical protein
VASGGEARIRRPLRWARRRRVRLLLVGAAALLVGGIALSDGDERSDRRSGQGGADSGGGSALGGGSTLGPDFALGGGLARCLEVNPRAGAGGAGEPEDTGEAIRLIQDQVELVRRLEFERSPEVHLLSETEMRARVGTLFDDAYEPRLAALDARLLEGLGAIPPGANLVELRRRSLEGQVVGLYDSDRGELLALSSGELGALERIVLAHELEHALADQRLGLPLPRRIKPRSADSISARQALVEGDATLAMTRYAARFVPLSDLAALLGDPEALLGAEAGLEGLSPFLRSELLFPYLEGMEFTCALYARGGWKAVDRAYHDPPESTYEVLFPERYGSAVGDPPAPGVLPGPWARRLRLELGAAPLLWLFEAPGGSMQNALPRARGFVSAWRGGELDLWVDGARSAIGVSLLERGDGPTLCAGVAGWYATAFSDARALPPRAGERLVSNGRRQDAVLRCLAGRVLLVIAPTLADARRLAG